MLLGTLGASLLGNMLAGKGIASGSGNKKGKGIVSAGHGKEWDFYFRHILWQIFKYKDIIKINQDLMVFILEMICLKKERMRDT